MNKAVLIQSLKQMWGIIVMEHRYRGHFPDVDHYKSENDYTLPFHGAWTVVNGGVSKKTSHSWDIPTQRYAYDFLILDEPVNGLDPQGIVEIRELILKLNREHGITVLISSHYLDELSRLATHFGFIDKGKLVKEISAPALEAACRKCAEITVSDTKILSRVLDKMGLDYSIKSDTHAEIYGNINVTDLTLKLFGEHCSVQSVNERNENLETFYINLMGGEKDE